MNATRMRMENMLLREGREVFEQVSFFKGVIDSHKGLDLPYSVLRDFRYSIVDEHPCVTNRDVSNIYKYIKDHTHIPMDLMYMHFRAHNALTEQAF